MLLKCALRILLNTFNQLTALDALIHHNSSTSMFKSRRCRRIKTPIALRSAFFNDRRYQFSKEKTFTGEVALGENRH